MEPKLEPSSTQQSDLSVDVQSPLASSPASISAEKSSDAASSSGRIRRPSALVASQDFVSGNRKRAAGSKAPPGDNGSGTPLIEKAASSTANTPIQGSQPELKVNHSVFHLNLDLFYPKMSLCNDPSFRR